MRIGILSFVAAVGLPSVALAQGPSHNDAAPPAEGADPTAEVLAAAAVIGRVIGVHHNSAERNGKCLDVGCCIDFNTFSASSKSCRVMFIPLCL